MSFLSYREAGNEIRHEQCTPCRRDYKYADISPCMATDCPYQAALTLLDRLAERDEAEQAKRERENQRRMAFRESMAKAGFAPEKIDGLEGIIDSLYLMANYNNPNPKEWGE